jgi:hypothetical protein
LVAVWSPQGDVYWLHALGGLALFAVATAYWVYLRLLRLDRRFALPAERARAALGRGGKRAWQVRNVVVYLLIFGLIGWLGVSGMLLYLDVDLPMGLLGNELLDLHFLAAWILLGMVAVHVAAQFAFGAAGRHRRAAAAAGFSWLLKMLRPRLVRTADGRIGQEIGA